MTFREILIQVLDLLQREGRVSYRAMKRQFNLDEEYLELGEGVRWASWYRRARGGDPLCPRQRS